MAATNSYPAFHTTGPVHNYIRVGGYPSATGNNDQLVGSGELWYLGTCETQPILKLQRYSRPVFNDIGGRSVPIQETYDGETADIGLMLSRFSQLAYGKLLSMNALLEPQPGRETVLSRGSLMYGPRTFELWQWFGFYDTAAATPLLPCGYYFPQVKLVNHGPEKFGSEGEVLLIQGQAVPKWFRRSSGASSFACYSQALVDFPSDVRGER